jgi:hypothetical protein
LIFFTHAFMLTGLGIEYDHEWYLWYRQVLEIPQNIPQRWYSYPSPTSPVQKVPENFFGTTLKYWTNMFVLHGINRSFSHRRRTAGRHSTEEFRRYHSCGISGIIRKYPRWIPQFIPPGRFSTYNIFFTKRHTKAQTEILKSM